MPELPEVETIRRELHELIVGKMIKKVEISLIKQVKNAKSFFVQKIQGKIVVKAKRRAKLLILELNNGYNLVFHLKMTGQLIYRAKSGKLAGGGHPIRQDLRALPNKYSHVIFYFSEGSKLFFNDTRQFGWVKLVTTEELQRIESKYGPEPLAIRNYRTFKGLFKERKKAIKPLMMEQKIIAGIGNIYAAEALFNAGVLPWRQASKIQNKEWQKLFQSLQKILKLAILMKGTSADDYVDAFGRQGSMESYLKVYGRKGKKCLRCGKLLKEIKQAARSTVYCGGCQR